MLRNGVTPIPPAIQICLGFATFCEKEPYGPSTTATAPVSSRAQRARVVAHGLDRDPQRRLAGRGGDREGVELVGDLAGANREDPAAHRELERMELLAQGERAEVDEQELPGREVERLPDRLHHDLGDELVQPVDRDDAVLPAAHEHVPEERAVDERGDTEVASPAR